MLMLQEAFDFLVSETYRTKPILRQIAKGVEKIAPGYGKFVAPVYIGYKGGKTFGTIAGKSAQETMARGGFVVFAPGSQEIDKYDISALGSTRII